MNQAIRPTESFAPASTWRLWIDRCGGFSLLVGDSYRVGGARPDGQAEIQVQSDWRREEGVITRREGDYFWRAVDVPDDQVFLRSGGVVPIIGAANLRFTIASPLSRSAVLSLDPPHRFGGHIDQAILVDQTVLIGPSSGNHIRCASLDESAVLFIRDGVWNAKLKSRVAGSGDATASTRGPVELVPGERVSLGDLDMMLEQV